MDANEAKDIVEKVAKGPASASGDSGSMSQHKLGDLVKFQRQVAADGLIKKKRRGLVFSTYVPPGTV